MVKKILPLKTILPKLTSRKARIIYVLLLICVIIIIQTSGWGYKKLIVFRWVNGKGLRVSIENGNNNLEEKSFTKQMLVIISCSPRHSTERDVIRKTWGNSSFFSPRLINVYFSMGTDKQYLNDVKKEALNHKDLILFDYIDSETNDTMKALDLLKYLSNDSLVSCDYIVITLHDVYLNLPKLYDYLPNRYTGLMMGNLYVYREPQVRKICINNVCQTFSYTERLLYSTYVTSLDVIRKLYNTTKGGRIIYSEHPGKDDFITGALPALANVTLFNHQMFTYIDTSTNPCVLAIIIVCHNLTSERIIEAHQNIMELKSGPHFNYQNKCEGMIIPPYVYNKHTRYYQNEKLLGPDNPSKPDVVILDWS